MKTLRQILKDRNIKQNVVADAVGVHVNHLRRYDDLSKRSVNDISLISKATGIEMSDLINEALGIKVELNNSTATSSQIGNSIGGHNVNMSIPDNVKSKIINDHGIEVTCEPLSSQETQQRINDLECKIKDLRETVALKNDLIESLRDKISRLENENN